MTVQFEKYHGTGNDFIMIDNRSLSFPKENFELIERLCHRRFGIGADGLILLENHDDKKIDFKMVYFNSDGKQSSMCGNGGRCLVAFAHSLGIFEEETVFEAIDGLHEATVWEDKISLKMNDVTHVEVIENGVFLLDTGSPHYVKVVDSFSDEFVNDARRIRNSDRFHENGVNVNFIIPSQDGLQIRTYERGVEDETYSCGTGAVAAAMCHALIFRSDDVSISTKGGELAVKFDVVDNKFSNIWLIGPAVKVFDGAIRLW
jgi:diaminopimelate epimerase